MKGLYKPLQKAEIAPNPWSPVPSSPQPGPMAPRVNRVSGSPRGTGAVLLSPAEFLDTLRKEKIRVDRSRAPLSIILFCFHDGDGEHGRFFRGFLNDLKEYTRETDAKGWLDHRAIGLILPDTDVHGARACLRKIEGGENDLPYSVVVRSYPDDLFKQFLDEGPGRPDLFPLCMDEDIPQPPVHAFMKRTIDVLGALVGLVLFAPLMAVTALAIKATSPGPVIFSQVRIGRKGERFFFHKFRSMVASNDDRIHREYMTSLIQGDHERIDQGEGNGHLYKIKADPRVTSVGRVIRKLSIDELPQFFNVLKGEMSLVGPRPPLAYEVEKYESWHLRRILEVKPGITGLWQVEGRSRTSFDDMVRLDLRYIRNWSLWLDFSILARILRAVVRSTGAV